MKKIYYIANARMPTERAHGIQLAKMCEAFVQAGADLELVIPSRTTFSKSIKDYYGLSVDIPLRRLPVIDLFSWGKAGFLFSSLSFIFSYYCYLLAKRIRGEQFVVYTIDMDQFSFAAVPFLGVPYGVEIHDAKPYGTLFSKLFRGASVIVVINELIKQSIVQRFELSGEKIFVHPNGIDLDFFAVAHTKAELRKKLALPLDKKIVLYAGKFYEWKGLEVLSKAAPFLPHDTVICVIGGDKSEFEQFTKIPTPDSVHVMGSRAYTEMPEWFAAADALLVLGTRANEYSYSHTSPMKLFEYMAARRPIVAADTPAIRQIASEEELFFYEPDVPESLARVIAESLTSERSTHDKIDHAHEKVRRYAWIDRGRAVLRQIVARAKNND